MTNHPLTPPPELVQEWFSKALKEKPSAAELTRIIAACAAQWGADQELEACLGEVSFLNSQALADRVRAARRPKPPSLKEQALALLDPSNTYGSVTREEEYRISVTKAEIIRRALEQLDD